MSASVGRDGFEHRFIGEVPMSEIQSRMEQLLSSEPSGWDQGDVTEWEELTREVQHRREENRVFSIGDEAVLVGYEMTGTNGAVGYMDNYNQNQYEVVVTGYSAEENKWEVMITEDTLEELIGSGKLDDDKWREMFIAERPANGGVSGYVITEKYRGVLESGARRKGVYMSEE